MYTKLSRVYKFWLRNIQDVLGIWVQREFKDLSKYNIVPTEILLIVLYIFKL